ncbi:MAG: hypothetical protein V2A79_07170, partial [Planctomycetota bacterium]
ISSYIHRYHLRPEPSRPRPVRRIPDRGHLVTRNSLRDDYEMAKPQGQVLAPAFTIRGSRTWRVVGQVIDLPLHDDGEGRSQGPALPG